MDDSDSSPWEQFTDGGFLFQVLSDENGTVKIVEYMDNASTVDIPSKVTFKDRTYIVDVIGYKSFQNKDLSVLVIPDTVRSLEGGAFDTCYNLKELTIPISTNAVADVNCIAFPQNNHLEKVTFTAGNGLRQDYLKSYYSESRGYGLVEDTPWKQSDSLKSVILSEGVKSIGNYMFYEMDLKNITFPSGLETIGRSAFYNSKNLESAILHDGLKRIEEKAFMDCKSLKTLVLPESTEHIDSLAFTNCKNLKELTIPLNLDLRSFHVEIVTFIVFDSKDERRIVEREVLHPLFEGCNKIENVTLIGAGAPYDYKDDLKYAPWMICKSSIKSLTISNDVTGFHAEYFRNLKNLKSLTLPISMDSVVDYEEPLFKNCKKLEKVTFTPGTGEAYQPDDYHKTPWYMSKDSLKTVIIPEGVTSISADMFRDCTKIKEANLPSTLMEIERDAFHNCKSLKTMTIPSGITKLEKSVFEGCKNLEEVILQGDITHIGDYAFKDCKSLKGIVMPDSLDSIGKQGFNGCKNLKDIKFSKNLTFIGEDSFKKFKFYSSDKKKLDTSVENLRGFTFTGKPSKMICQETSQ